jgi:signal transduction histidine kinase
VFPALIWVAIRFRQNGATAGTLIVWISAIVATALGHGPFANGSLSESLLPLQMFMAVVAIATLFRAATVCERDTAIRARDEFLAIASHELRTPLTTIGLTVSSLREKADTLPPDKLRKRLELLDRQSERVSVLVGNLLDVSRIMSAQFDLATELVRVDEVIHEVVARVRDQATAAGSELVVAVDEAPPITSDRMRVEQIVTNLVGNALKFGAGKPIEIGLRETPSSLVLTVRDHGVGIASRDHARIFQRFERVDTKRGKGLGLGLWIVRQIVVAMGGTITVTSELGKGAELTVTLPKTHAKS